MSSGSPGPEFSDRPFLSGWDDPEVVAERLGTALDDAHGSGNSATRIESAACESLADHSGLSGDLQVLTVTLSESGARKEIKLLIKQSMPGEEKAKSSKAFGKHREAYMYSTIGPWLRERARSDCSFIPRAHYAVADPSVGQYSVVTDYYDGSIEAGLFYPKSIHNSSNERRRARDLPPSITRRDVTLEAVRVAARIHGCFLLDGTLLSDERISEHLRMADWIQGNGRESFLASQQMIQDGWRSAKIKHDKGENDVAEMKQEFIEVMDASVGQALDFDAFVSKWSGAGAEGDLPFTLVHGDFHPGNLLVPASSVGTGRVELVLVDWEAVGVGSGPQDIGQYLISHTDAAEAVDMLGRIASLYRETLVDTVAGTNPSLVGSVPSAESTRREMIYGGLERWVWLFAVMCGMPIPSNYMQYFHDQMYDWMVLNDVTPETIGMPRP